MNSFEKSAINRPLSGDGVELPIAPVNSTPSLDIDKQLELPFIDDMEDDLEEPKYIQEEAESYRDPMEFASCVRQWGYIDTIEVN